MKQFMIFTLLLLVASMVNAQGVGINITGSPADPSAMLDVAANNKGFLPPRMTVVERDAIVNPATGLIIYNTTENCVNIYNGSQWMKVCGCSNPAAPTSGSHVPAATQIVWNWNTVSDATGYKYSTVNNYSGATDNGVSTTFTQTGLTCGGTAYTLYVWAYSDCGNSVVQALNASTDVCGFVCGNSLTVNHNTSDGISPQTKILTYNTVSYIGKCWISKNLGADNQPSSGGDATDAAAGWYWQFNRIQGYAPGPIPASFNTAPEGTGNWMTSNDPCPVLLGAGWRIPTSTEWATASSGWSNYNSAYSSALKLHAGGNLLLVSSGNLSNRGYSGRYWSSTQYDATYGTNLHLGNSSVNIETSNSQAHGFMLRCMKD